jgi:ubiquinone/menaquinone biosynthesis C-methylase UbiE
MSEDERRSQTPAEAYQEYYGPAIFQPLAEELIALAGPREGERILDIACGTGIATRRAAEVARKPARAVGVDLNPGMVAVATSLAPPDGVAIEWRQGDGTALDLPDGSFDLVLCQQGLQFFPDRAAGVREMRRVLAPGGRVALATWQGPEWHPLYVALADVEVPHLESFGIGVTRDDALAPFSLGDADEVRALLEGAGFSDVTIETRTIDVRFAEADHFVERLESAYAAVIPQFVEDPARFEAYLAAVADSSRDIVQQYREGDHVVTQMHTHITLARA